MKTNLKTLSISFLMLFSIAAFAQESIDLSDLSPDGQTGWQVYQKNNTATIYYQYTKCEIIEFVVFKIQNLTDYPLTISWVYRFQLDGQLLDSNPDDTQIQLLIPANESLESNCNYQIPELSIFIAEDDGIKRLSTIELSELNFTVDE